MNSVTLVNENITIYDVFCIESVIRMAVKQTKDWEAQVKGLLKAELKRRNLSYADLAKQLCEIGINDNERNISNKIARGSFTAVFFVQCLEAIGCKSIRLDESS